MKRALLLALGIALFICTISFAEVPHQISYQGILKDSTGAPVEDAVYAIKFRIYDDSTAGNALWETAGFVPIQTHDGLFQHALGSTNPLPDSLAQFPNQWVGIAVNLGTELTPRMRLTSAPFSLAAQFADTARVSLDKTIDASELIMGALDTARFSAYQDLASENKIGPAPDQVAAGDHAHTGVSFPGTMVRVEDTTFIEHYLPPNAVLKTIEIPPNRITNYFRLSFVVEYSVASTLIYIDTRLNGQYLTNPIRHSVHGITICKLSGIKLDTGRWIIEYRYAGTPIENSFGYQEINSDPTAGLTIEISATSTNTAWAKLGEVIVEYDAD